MCVLTSSEAPSPSNVEGSLIVIIDTNDRWNYDTARMEITPPLLLLSCWAVTATAAAIVLGSHSHSHRCCYRAGQSQPPLLLSCWAVTATAAAIVLGSHNGSRRAMKATVISVTRVTSRNLVLARLSP
jgi:hypothetical protein